MAIFTIIMETTYLPPCAWVPSPVLATLEGKNLFSRSMDGPFFCHLYKRKHKTFSLISLPKSDLSNGGNLVFLSHWCLYNLSCLPFSIMVRLRVDLYWKGEARKCIQTREDKTTWIRLTSLAAVFIHLEDIFLLNGCHNPVTISLAAVFIQIFFNRQMWPSKLVLPLSTKVCGDTWQQYQGRDPSLWPWRQVQWHF